MEKASQNIQDSFLNAVRRERQTITIFLLSGVKLSGRIRSFDKYCLVLESSAQEQMIFKHAISTIVLQRAGAREHPAARAAEARPRPEAPTAAAAAEGDEES